MKKLIKEIVASSSSAIDCTLLISIGSGIWLEQARLLKSSKIFITEPYNQLAERISKHLRNSTAEELVQVAITGEKISNAKLNIYNDLKYNSINPNLTINPDQINIRKVGEISVPAKSLSEMIDECDADHLKNNLLVLNSVGQSADLVRCTPTYYLTKFSWILIVDTLDSSSECSEMVRLELEMAGFKRVAIDADAYPFHETLYRRSKSDNIYSSTALDRILLTHIPNIDHFSSPQKAFDLFCTYNRTRLPSDLVSAFLESLSVANFSMAKHLLEELEQGDCHPKQLASFLKEKLALEVNIFSRNTTPDISVIIPYHNREQVITFCINSVLNQTIKNIEVIAVDDGSTDNSRAVVSSIEDSRLIRINCDVASGNSGTPRNIALKRAKGKYIAFVDSDDTIDEGYFEELLTKAKDTDADVILSKSFTKLYKDTNGNRKSSRINYIYKPGFIADAQKQYFFVNSFVIWDKLYKRSFLSAHNIKLAESKIGADTLMVAKVYYHATNVSMCTNRATYNYNAFSEGSVTQIYRSRGDIREEDRPYAETFKWMMDEDVSKAYVLIQWIRRLMSLSYCLSSSTEELSPDAATYLEVTLKEAPFKSALTHLKRKGLTEQYLSLQHLMKLLGRKVINV